MNILEESSAGLSSAREGAVECREYSDFSACAHLRDRWDDLCRRTAAPLYLTYDWTRLWWQFYGASRRLRLFTFESGGDLVGVIPFYVDRLGFPPMDFKIARLLGAMIPARVSELPVEQSVFGTVLKTVLSRLMGQDGCDCVSFGPIREDWHGSELVRNAPSVAREAGSVESRVIGMQTSWVFPATFEDFLQSLRKSEKKNRREYELKMLRKDFQTEVELIKDFSAASAEFEKFAEQHTIQWNAEKKPGHFKSWPRCLEFHRALVECLGKAGMLRFVRIVANGQVISNQYIYEFGDCYYWELPSRVVGSEWDRFSLGRTGLATLIEVAIREGVHRMEGGIGDYEYKRRLNAQETKVCCYNIVRNNPGSARKYQLFSKAGFLVKMGVNKIWYRRVQRLMPAQHQSPQPFFALRYDF